MAVWRGAFSRGVGGVALGLGFLAATAGPAMADTCASIGSNPSLNGEVPEFQILPPFTHTTFDVILAQGDRLTFAWTNLSFPFFEVVIIGESEELIETNPEEPSDGSHEYVASKDATFTIRAFGTGGFGGGSQSVTCTPDGSGGGGGDGDGDDDDDNADGDDDPVTGADRAAAERDAMVRGLRSAAPSVSPAGLPGSAPASPAPAPGAALDACWERYFELQKQSRAANLEAAKLEDEAASVAPDLPVDSGLIDAARKRAAAAFDAEQLQRAFCERFADALDPGLGDGEAILFAPQERSPAARVPWPANVSAYAHDGAGRIDASEDHSFMFDGRPALFWTRTRATLLDGSLDRSGVAGSFQAGVVVGVSPVLDVGAFAHLLGGAVKSTALDGELETIAGALGGYAKAKLPGGGTLGFSTSHEWGANDITLGGATGSFASSLWTVDADFSAAPWRVDGFVVTPVAALAWKQAVNGAYVDSNALAVPETRDSTLALSGAIDVARPTYVGGPVVRIMTPRATLRGNWFVKQADTLDLGTLGTIESGALTFDLSGGVAFGLVGGGTFDASLTASGLAGAERGYSIRLGYRAPLN